MLGVNVGNCPTLQPAPTMLRHLTKTEPLAWPLLLCLAASFLSVFTIDIADPDLWGHVRYGADTIRQGHLFETDPYSYSSDGFPWINHELLCELTLGYVEPRWGAIGMQVWKSLMGLVLIACIVWSHRRSQVRGLTIRSEERRVGKECRL